MILAGVKFLTTTDAPSAFALVGVRRGEVKEQSLLEDFFVSIYGTCSQEIVQYISLHHGMSLAFNRRCHL